MSETTMSEENDEIAKHLIGMTLDKAQELYARSGWIVRCVKKDGKARAATQELLPNRLNVETEKGIITKVVSHG